jgi:adenosylmethionine-8-amino-7-oxononanoate aminotransferase
MSNSSVFYRDLNNPPKVLSSVNNNEYLTMDGVQSIDVSSGAGNMCLGLTPSERMREVIANQLELATYAHAANFTTTTTELLAEKLLTLAGGRFIGGRVVFLNTGAEAVEAACKIAYQYHGDGTHRFIGRKHSYHGSTMLTLSLGDHPRKRDHLGLTCHSEFSLRLPALNAEQSFSQLYYGFKFQAVPPSYYRTTVVVETIGGTCAAIEPPTAAYLQHLRNEVDRVNGVLIYDEILCGNYRTGYPFAYQAFLTGHDVEPDMVCIGKGLTGGFFPLSAVLVSKRIVEAIHQRDGVLHHSSTNQNHPLGCAIALAALEEYETILQEGIWDDYRRSVAIMVDSLCLSPEVDSVVGIGGLWGIRLREHADQVSHSELRRRLLANGVAAYTEGGTITGKDRMILFAPNYYMSKSAMTKATNIIMQTLDEVVR